MIIKTKVYTHDVIPNLLKRFINLKAYMSAFLVFKAYMPARVSCVSRFGHRWHHLNKTKLTLFLNQMSDSKNLECSIY